jgi:hypothetical protein
VREILTPDAIESLHYSGHGTARQINRLADLALLVGFADHLPQLAAEQIEAVSEARLAMLLGGRAAEKLQFDQFSAGA